MTLSLESMEHITNSLRLILRGSEVGIIDLHYDRKRSQVHIRLSIIQLTYPHPGIP